MNPCTYTVYVKEKPEDGGAERPVPCGKSAVGTLTGPAIRLRLCPRHVKVVAKAITHQGPEYRLTLDGELVLDMAATGDD